MKKWFVDLPLPKDAFPDDDLLEENDTKGSDIEVSIIEKEINDDDFGVIEESYNIMYFCDWFGCTITNDTVCKQCGIFWIYFSISEH